MSTHDHTTINCIVCCREIPLDAAFTPEGAEYVEHFCGLDCYDVFRVRATEKVVSKVEVKPEPHDGNI